MNWKEIQISGDWTYFHFEGQPLFGKTFLSVLKFKGSGIAPVRDESGWYFIDSNGEIVIEGPFRAAWGFYEGLCAVLDASGAYHILEDGTSAYSRRFAWCGNFQEGFCTVRDHGGNYFHIHPDGRSSYASHYQYAGDFKDGLACVMQPDGRFKHINAKGEFIYATSFADLGVYHKGFATARDERGWFHIDMHGNALYGERYAMLEPFYNGVAFGEGLDGRKVRVVHPFAGI